MHTEATTDDVDAAVHDFVVSKNADPSPLGGCARLSTKKSNRIYVQMATILGVMPLEGLIF